MERSELIPANYSNELRGWYRLFRVIVGFLLRRLSHLEIHGLENVPDGGPLVLVSNHLHWLDPPALMVAFPRRSCVFAAEKWETHWFFGPLFRSMGAIFVQRGEVDRRALRQALAVLDGGGVLALAPEGTRSRTGAMQRGRSGAGYLSVRTGVKVLPVVVTGQEKLFPTLKRLRRARVRVAFGPTLEPPRAIPGEKPSAEQVHAFAQEIMYHLAALLPPEYRGVYQDVAYRRPELVARYWNDGGAGKASPGPDR